jgi:crotonobetainyl-CoA:carnitine CoA-transferase CaiB-like acyl-CoA transferase
MTLPHVPLAGVRIADFTIHAAGPFCTHLLSQLGAECIKIESRTRPDAFRKPHAVYGRMTAATFDQVSANKLSVRLNLKKPEAVALAKRLVSLSDVAAESFRPGVMKRLGLDYNALRQIKSDLIMLSLSSSGQYGPDAHFAGYAPLFGAWGGLGWMSGYPDGPPMEMRHVMDHAAGYHAVVALTAALHQHRRTGQGQYVDLAAREVASAMIGDALVLASLGEEPQRPGNGDLAMAPYGVYGTAEPGRWLTLAVRNDAEWNTLVEVIGDADMADDPRFASVEARCRHQSDLNDLLTHWLANREAESTAVCLQEAGVCAHVSWTMQDIIDDPHLHARGALTAVADTSVPKRYAAGAPARFTATPEVGIRRGTPELGQDEEYVFGELLGLSAERRRGLEEREVIL